MAKPLIITAGGRNKDVYKRQAARRDVASGVHHVVGHRQRGPVGCLEQPRVGDVAPAVQRNSRHTGRRIRIDGTGIDHGQAVVADYSRACDGAGVGQRESAGPLLDDGIAAARGVGPVSYTHLADGRHIALDLRDVQRAAQGRAGGAQHVVLRPLSLIHI